MELSAQGEQASGDAARNGSGRRDQGHTGQEEPQIQSSAGLEAIHTAIPPPGLNSQVGEGWAASFWNQGAGP